MNEKTMQGTVRDGGVIKAILRYVDRPGEYTPPYEGSYNVRPALDAQTMQTAGRIMKKDVTVEAIPIAYIGNTAGGETAIIG